MKLNNEAKVGLTIVLSFTIFITFVALLAKINVARSGYHLQLYFGFLNGLSIGAPVRIAGGVKIGQVDSITHSGEKTNVSVWVDNNYTLLKTAKFAIFTTGLIGEKYINVFIPPSINVDEFFQDGDKIYAVDPASFDQMMLSFQGFLQDESGSQLLAEIFQNSEKFVANLNRISEENRDDIRQSVSGAKFMIAQTSDQLSQIMANMNKLTSNMAYLSDKNREEFTITMRNLSELSVNLNKIMFRLENGRGTLGKLLIEEEVYDNLKDASISAKELFRSLKQDPSKLFFKQNK
ncbi:MAG: MlaD family protein [Spirochaetia bacterium]|jgi:phospholipid/cholesterol/gamma-HCH transport system substrate-binding protein|nr:MlaD family protein [Spirochaetia bacterium]